MRNKAPWGSTTAIATAGVKTLHGVAVLSLGRRRCRCKAEKGSIDGLSLGRVTLGLLKQIDNSNRNGIAQRSLHDICATVLFAPVLIHAIQKSVTALAQEFGAFHLCPLQCLPFSCADFDEKVVIAFAQRLEVREGQLYIGIDVLLFCMRSETLNPPGHLGHPTHGLRTRSSVLRPVIVDCVEIFHQELPLIDLPGGRNRIRLQLVQVALAESNLDGPDQ